MDVKYYIKKIKEKIIRYFFHRMTKSVFDLPSADHFSSDHDEVILLSMLQETDVQMYLLAVKSMMQYLQVSKVVIVCDPRLTQASKNIIQQHVVNVDFLDALQYQHEQIPQGGCWERLYAISHVNQDAYVIQMDADILVLKPPQEVIDAVKLNRSFILGTNSKFNQISISEMSATAAQWTEKYEAQGIEPHIQVKAEVCLAKLAETLGLTNYTRGCAGFAGFAKGSITPKSVRRVSQSFRQKLGKQWNSWGTEQFASNLLLSNTADVTVLPTDKYNSSDRYTEDFIFSHFIGSSRFFNTLYLRLAQQVIIKLKTA